MGQGSSLSQSGSQSALRAQNKERRKQFVLKFEFEILNFFSRSAGCGQVVRWSAGQVA